MLAFKRDYEQEYYQLPTACQRNCIALKVLQTVIYTVKIMATENARKSVSAMVDILSVKIINGHMKNWIVFFKRIKIDQVCRQISYNKVQLSDPLSMQSYCTGVKGSNYNVECQLINSCVDGSTRCVDDCNCDGYFEQCVDNHWIRMELPSKNINHSKIEETICSTYNRTTIQLQHSCPEFGSQGNCNGRVKGTCGCRKSVECVNGNQLCINKCDCNGYYKICDNGRWTDMKLPSKNKMKSNRGNCMHPK